MANEMKDSTAMKRRTFLTGTAASLAAMTITIPAGRALAAGYPERPITLVVMYAAGGGTDTVMRKIADEMAKARNWQVTSSTSPAPSAVWRPNMSTARPQTDIRSWAAPITTSSFV